MTKFSWLFIIAMIFYGCGGDDEVTVGDPPLANAGADIEAFVGSSVTLNGAASTDPEGGPLTYSWELTQRPAGSSATISGSTGANANFTPDEVGLYTARLTVTDEDNNSAFDEVVIDAVADGGPGSETIIIDADINSDTVWEDVFNDPSRADYRIVSNIDVNALLSIEPGVVVEVEQGLELVVTSEGGLAASGSSTQPIRFTSSNVDANFKWKGIGIYSADQRNELNNVIIEHGGSEAFEYVYNGLSTYIAANLTIDDGARISITNSMFRNSEEAGILVQDGAELITFEGNTLEDNETYAILTNPLMVEEFDNTSEFNNNGTNGVAFFNGTMNTGTDHVWNQLQEGISIYGIGNLVVEDLLTFNPGVSILMSLDRTIRINTDGGLISEGTENNRISISSAGVASGLFWGGLSFYSSDSRNNIEYTDISYGGSVDADYVYNGYSAYVRANVYVNDGAYVSINHSTISNSDEFGVVINDSGELGSFGNNLFENNASDAVFTNANTLFNFAGTSTFSGNGANSVRVYRGDLQGSGTISALDASGFYLINGEIDIVNDVVIEAGANFEIKEDVFIDIETTGSLIAIGSASENITFTTADLAGGRLWGGIRFYSTSSLNEFDNVSISHAGGDDAMYFYGSVGGYVQSNITLDGSAKLKLTNSSISNSGGYGLAISIDATVNGIGSEDADNIANIIAANTGFSANAVDNIVFE